MLWDLRRIGVINAVGAISVAALATLALGQAKKTRSQEEAAQALSRVKQISIAAILYCSDYDDIFPYAQSTETAVSVLLPYAKNRAIFTSPTKGGKFVYNTNVGGVNAADIPAPANTPVWVEKLPDASDPAVGYADGHGKLIGPAMRSKLAAALKQKLPRRKNSKPLPKNWKGL